MFSGSLHGGRHFAKTQDTVEQYRKAARIALDTSAHAGSEYHNFMRLSTDRVRLHIRTSLIASSMPQSILENVSGHGGLGYHSFMHVSTGKMFRDLRLGLMLLDL